MVTGTCEVDPNAEESDEGEEEENTVKQPMYPEFSKLRGIKLKKPLKSEHYGDPNDPEVLNWYVSGNTYQHKSVVKPRPETNEPKPSTSSHPQQSSSKNGHISTDQQSPPPVLARVYKVRDEFCAKPLHLSPEADARKIIEEQYTKQKIGEAGYFFRNKQNVDVKYQVGDIKMNSSYVKVPPIIVPSCGRSDSALLDYSGVLTQPYIQIVVVRFEELEKYIRRTCKYPNIDLLVLKKGAPKTIGGARCAAKKLMEKVLEECENPFFLMLDDNVHFWSGITLKNDENPMFGMIPTHERSQVTNIKFQQVLDYFKRENWKERDLDKFALIGFQTRKYKNKRNYVNAFNRTHVFAAVMINVKKLENVHYNGKCWAMEDIKFNFDIDKLWQENKDHGVIIKALRFQATKLAIEHGGIQPFNIPKDIEKDVLNWKKRGKRMLEDDTKPTAKRPRFQRNIVHKLEACIKRDIKDKGYNPDKLTEKDVKELMEIDIQDPMLRSKNKLFYQCFANTIERIHKKLLEESGEDEDNTEENDEDNTEENDEDNIERNDEESVEEDDEDSFSDSEEERGYHYLDGGYGRDMEYVSEDSGEGDCFRIRKRWSDSD